MQRAREGWLLRAWDSPCNCPVSLAGVQLSPPARLSTWSEDQLGGTALGRPIEGRGAGRKACLGSGWAQCPGREVRGSAALQPPSLGDSPSQPIAQPRPHLYKAGAAGSSSGSAVPPGHRQPLLAQPRQVPPWGAPGWVRSGGPMGAGGQPGSGRALPVGPPWQSVRGKVDLESGSPLHP